jgi:hypothetical protein
MLLAMLAVILLCIPGIIQLKRIKAKYIFYVNSLVVFVLSFVVMAVLHNKEHKRTYQLCKYFDNNQWEQIVDYTEGVELETPIEAFCVNWARFENNTLLNDLFKTDQKFRSDGITLGSSYIPCAMVIKYKSYLRLGLINEAEHLLYELNVQEGVNAKILSQQIEICLIKENFVAAEKYYELLKKVPFRKKLVDRYKPFVQDHISYNKELTSEFKSADHKGVLLKTGNDKNTINYLRYAYSQNSKARDYILAYYLITKDKASFQEYFFKTDYLHNPAIPQYIAEAYIMYTFLDNKGGMVLDSPKIKEIYENDFRVLYGLLRKHKGDVMAAKSEISKQLPHTFFNYYFFK